MYCIRTWTGDITASGKPVETGEDVMFYQRAAFLGLNHFYDFRLLDDDGVVYGYGVSTDPDSFAPVDRYMPIYGCTQIEYLENGKWIWKIIKDTEPDYETLAAMGFVRVP